MEQELKNIIVNYKHPEINLNFISEKNIKIEKISDKYKIDIEINFFDRHKIAQFLFFQFYYCLLMFYKLILIKAYFHLNWLYRSYQT